MPARKKRKLPPHVCLKHGGKWYVKRDFPTKERDSKGRTVYRQIVRRCDPETAAQAEIVSNSIASQYNNIRLNKIISRKTVSGLVDEFCEAKESSVEPRTVQYYKWMRDQVNGLGRMEVEAVTPRTIQDYYRSLKDTTSPKMIRKIHSFLSMVFRQGVRWEAVKRNPCEGVVIPRAPKPKIEVMDEEEARAFMAVCLAEPKYLVLAFALDSWMRPGEYLALDRKNLDLDNHTVFVERSVSFRKGGGWYFKSPKTESSVRTIKLTPQICEALKDVPDKGLVFPSRTGEPINSNNLGTRTMTAACKVIGKHHSLYSLRHSGASIALARGAHVKAVSERLGHSDIQVTLNFYGHVLKSMRSNATEILAEALY